AVREELLVLIPDPVVRLERHEEVARNESRPLVEELEERVLAVRSRLAPDDRTAAPFDRAAIAPRTLAVALHVELLEVGGTAVERLTVREHGVGLGAEEVAMPTAEKPEERGKVAGEVARGAEVLIDRRGAREHLLESVHADRERDGKADRAPHRVAPADPVPELEHVLDVDSEASHRVGVRRDRDEMAGYGVFRSQRVDEPRPCRARVRDRLLRGERLRGDDEERALGIDRLERPPQVSSVDVRDEARIEPLVDVRLER